MLLAMTVFGANDLYMFGTNWTGATLRHDWLALLGFAAAALKRERWTASVTYVFRDAVQNGEIQVNPLGLTIVSFRADQAFE